jgi:TPP-dependent pyruvate/acetoin dehydrogenase alpha subunit
VTQIEKKRAAYGIEAEAVDGMDLMAVIDAADTAVQKVRSTGKPYLLVCNTYRFKAHSMFDAELWDQEIDEWKKREIPFKITC